MRHALVLAALAGAVAGCGELEETPVAGEYVRGAFHLYLYCPGQTPDHRAEDLLYPVNFPGQTWKIDEDGHDLTMTWDGLPLAQGRRTTEGIFLDFDRIDPYGDPVSWTFEGRLLDDLVFHERTISGRITSGTRDDCLILPNSVAWFTMGKRERERPPIDPDEDARARGWWNRFVWFLDIGPYGMSRKGDDGQRGRNLRLFSFAATSGGQVIAGDDGTFFDNGFGTPWPGAARGGASEFEQSEDYWDLAYEQDVIFDDRGGNEGLGVHRVLSGFVGGDYRVIEQNYPFGWEGETGMLPLKQPGMAFWLDLTRPDPPPDASANFGPEHSSALARASRSLRAPLRGPPAPEPRVVAREEGEGESRSPAIRLVDGELVW